MKRNILLLLCCLAIVSVKADTIETTINGELASSVLNTNLKELTISGPLDARDIDFLFRQMIHLEVLDLSDANIIAYHEDGGGYTYPANEFPQYAFYSSQTSDGKTSLKSVILPKSITSIGTRAFANCKGLTQIEIPNTVNEIGSRAFVNCSGLKTLTIPVSVKKIGARAFEECSGLNSITINCIDAEISDYVFRECYEVLSVTVAAKTPLDLNTAKLVFQGINPKCVLYIPTGSTNAYNISPQWQDFPKIVEK
jgi:BspA type Leucine rich repeat region (6 copies)